MWFMLCRSVVGKTVKPASAFIKSVLKGRGIDMSEYNGDIPLD